MILLAEAIKLFCGAVLFWLFIFLVWSIPVAAFGSAI